MPRKIRRRKKPKHIKVRKNAIKDGIKVKSDTKYWADIKRCPYISPILECFAGGEGHVGCMHPSFHEYCEIKQSGLKSGKTKTLNSSR